MKKLSFFLLSTLLSLIATAQVPVFTAGLINDSILYSGNFNDTLKQVYNLTQTSSIDLNQDGQPDFVISYYWVFSSGVTYDQLFITPLNTNKIAVDQVLPCYNSAKQYNIGKIFREGDPLNSTSLNYKDTTVFISINDYITGNGSCNSNTWNSLNDGFIGVEFIESGLPVNGWIHLGIFNGVLQPAVIIIDYCANRKRITSTSEISRTTEWTVYPNPACETIVFRAGANPPSGTLIILYNGFGKSLMQKELLPGETTMSVDVRAFSSGIYLYEIVESNGTRVRNKWVKIP
jgi:hypothetical protein